MLCVLCSGRYVYYFLVLRYFLIFRLNCRKAFIRVFVYSRNTVQTMATFTVSIDRNLKAQMDAHSDINWPEYLRLRFVERLAELRMLESARKRKN